MRSATFFVPLTLAASLSAQTLSDVQILTPNPTECHVVVLEFSGTLPQDANFSNLLVSVDPDTIAIGLSAFGGWGCPADFDQPMPGIGSLSPGTYVIHVVFEYNGSPVDSFTTAITIGPGFDPDAGVFNTWELCNSEADLSLLNVLGGTPDPGGTWFDPFGQVVLDGVFDPGLSPEGTYTYLFDLQPPCEDAYQQVVVTYTPNDEPGFDAVIPVCAASGSEIDLFDELGGTPATNGTWTDPLGTPHNGTFDPLIDPCGGYTYTIPGVAPCGSASSTVTIDCTTPADAGADGSITLCVDAATVNLNEVIIGEQDTGCWNGPDGGFVATYNEPVDALLNGAGTYMYVVQGGICPNDTSYVVVELLEPPCGWVGVAVQGTQSSVGFAIFEDPVVDELRWTGGLDRGSVAVFDAMGHRVSGGAFNGSRSVIVKELAAGPYVLFVQDASGSRQSVKFIKR